MRWSQSLRTQLFVAPVVTPLAARPPASGVPPEPAKLAEARAFDSCAMGALR
jgi:hypothetical protein